MVTVSEALKAGIDLARPLSWNLEVLGCTRVPGEYHRRNRYSAGRGRVVLSDEDGQVWGISDIECNRQGRYFIELFKRFDVKFSKGMLHFIS